MKRVFWPLAVIVAIGGLVLRLWNIDFDQRQHLHPDERFWSITSDAMHRTPPAAEHGTIAGPLLDWLDGQRSPSNPYRATESFLYGPISLTLARTTAGWLHDGVAHGDQPAAAVADTLDWLGVPLIDADGQPRFDNAYGVDLVGRMIGAVFDTVTIIVIILIGRRVGGRAIGLVAGGFYALSVLAIQLAHFLGSEPLLGLGCALTVLCTVRLDRGASVRRAASGGLAVGLAIGLATAAKLTAVGLAAVPALGCMALVAIHRRRSDVVRLVSLGLGAAIAFRILEPSAFNGLGLSLSRSFLDDLQRASDLSTSTAPPSFQWADRRPVLQPVVWLTKFTVGPGVVLAALFGAAVMSVNLFGERFRAAVGRWRTGRFREPSLRVLNRWARLTSDTGRWPVAAIIACTAAPFSYIVATALPTGRYFIPMLPGLMVMAAFGTVAAIRWARSTAGRTRLFSGSIAALSVGLAVAWGIGFVHGVYGTTNTRIEASRWIAANVPAGSVLSSEAWDDGLPLRLPGVNADAYTSEQLNLVGPDDEVKVAKVADQLSRIDYVIESSARISDTVTRMPARFPSTINFFHGLDSGKLGFTRVATFSSGIGLGPWQLDDRKADEAFSVFDHPQVRIWQKTEQIDRNSIVAVLDPVAAANAVAVDPNAASSNGLMLEPAEVATNATGDTYDEAFDTSGSSAVHVIGWMVLLELIGLAGFVIFLPLFQRLPDAGLGLSKIISLVGLSFVVFIAAAWLHVDLSRSMFVAVVTLFVGAGAAVAWRRRETLVSLCRSRARLLIAVEMAMIAAFLVVVAMRSMDPDLWHPDRGGEKPFEMALLTAVLRTKTLPVYDPWFSAGALNYYYGGWLILSVPARVLRTSPTLVMNIGLAAMASCAAGAAFSTAAGGVDAARRHGFAAWPTRRASRRTAVAGLLGTAFVLALANNAIIRATWRHITRDGSAATVDWWGLSRVIPHSVAITEFPSWSILFADLHPHVMGIAVLLLVGALCLVWHAALVDGRRAHVLALAVAIGVSIGMVRATNTWDYPVSLAFAAVAVVAALARRARWQRCATAAVLAGVTLMVGWSPYVSRGEVFDAGFDAAQLRTRFSSWLEQFGLFAAVTVFVTGAALVIAVRQSTQVWHRITNAHVAVAGVALVTIGYVVVRPGRGTFVSCSLLALGCGWSAVAGFTRSRQARTDARSPVGPFVLAAGWAVQAGVELVNVRNDGGRQNTVFKFWYESWILLAIGAAIVIAEQLLSRRSWRRRTAGALLAVMGALSVAFWWLTLPVRTDDRISLGGASLDGEAYLRTGFTVGADDKRFVPGDDVALIDWLRANVRGLPAIAEAPGDDYRWTSRISWSTGLPTPIGWPYHESQQRRPYGGVISARQTDMMTLYTTSDEREIARVLSRYSIAYVVFGTQERLLSSDASAEALRSFPCLKIEATEVPDAATGGLVPASPRDTYYVAAVDRACVSRLRPPLPPAPAATS